MMTTKKNKQVLMSSDEEDENNTNTTKKRSSQRLKRRSRSSFVMPSRNKIWDTIPNKSPPITSLKSISPRKTVSDFTKVYNTYNFDDYEDSSDDGSEGFTTDSSSNPEGDSSDSDEQKCVSGRVKNYRRRIKSKSSSDEENNVKGSEEQENDVKCSEEQENNVKDNEEQENNVKGSEEQENNVKGSEEKELPKESDDTGEEPLVLENDLDKYFVDNKHGDIINADESSSSDEGISPVKRRRNASILESDEESGSSNSNCSGPSEEEVKDCRSLTFKKKKDELFQRFKDIQKEKKALQKS